MQTFTSIAVPATAVLIGACIGLGFGHLQNVALRSNQKRENAGQFKSGWSLMPGSGTRVALLLLTLALIQVACPALFFDGAQWWVSGGVAAGYGWSLYKQLRLKRDATP